MPRNLDKPYKLPPMPKLKWDRNEYNPYGLKQRHEEAEVRKEYTRLRSIAQKRLQRFKGTEWEQSAIYQRYSKRFKTLKQLGADKKAGIKGSDVQFALSEVVSFLEQQASSVSGQKERRRKALITLSEHGYDFVNEKNFHAFGEYMEYVREVTNGTRLASEQAAEMYDTAQQMNISADELKKQFEAWYTQEQDDKNRVLMILKQGSASEWLKQKSSPPKNSPGHGSKRKKR